MIVNRYRYDESFAPREDTVKFFLWMHSIFEEENKTPKMHFQIVDHLNSNSKYKVVECHRGAAKSTLVNIYQVLYWAYTGEKPGLGKVDFVLIIQETKDMSANTLEQIANFIEDNAAMSDVLEIKRKSLGDDPTLELFNKSTGRRFYVKGRGSGQSIRGMRVNGNRPNVVILDDIENDKDVLNPESRKKLKNWFVSAVLPTVNPNRFEFIFIGTPLHEDSLLMTLINGVDEDIPDELRSEMEWSTIQLPVAEKLTTDMILGRSDEPLISSWPDRFTREYIRSQYFIYKNAGQETEFFQEYMLDIAPREGLLYDVTRIGEYDNIDFSSGFRFYVGIDLAVSEKNSADYTAIAVIAVDVNNNWYLVDGDFGRWRVGQTIEKIFEFVGKWKPEYVAIEKVGFQASMKDYVETEMVRRGKFFNLNMFPRTTSKLSVFKAFSVIVDAGKLFVPKKGLNSFKHELISEMKAITNDRILAKHDDILDSIAQLTVSGRMIGGSTLDYDAIEYSNYTNSVVF